MVKKSTKGDIMVTMKDVFHNVQFNKTCHKKYIDLLNAEYEKIDLDTFFEAFISCLKVPMSRCDQSSTVNNCIEFAGKFIVEMCPFDDETEEMDPFFLKTFNWIMKYHRAESLSARYGVCRFLNALLNAMGQEAALEQTLCESITKSMSERVLDKSPRVRVQAILALHRLQYPQDKNCPVIKMFIEHLLEDPSHEVRKTILSCLAKNKETLLASLKKIQDVHEDVRKNAVLFLSRITVKSLSLEQRESILTSGLKDSSEKVRTSVKTVLLPSWLRNYNNEYLSLLNGLDVENAVDMSMSCLDILFREAKLETIIEQAKVDRITRVIAIEQITSESVVYWYCLLKYVKQEFGQEHFEELVPELSLFCTYIREYMNCMNNGTRDESWDEISQKFVLHRLFEIAALFDLSDENGRSILRQLILDTLTSKHLSDDIIDCVVKQMENIIPSVDDRLTTLTSVINELRMPTNQQQQVVELQISEDEMHERKMKKVQLRILLCELMEKQYVAVTDKNFQLANELKDKISKVEEELTSLSKESEPVPVQVEEVYEMENNDPETLWKCLKVMCVMMQANSVKSLNLTLRSLMANLAQMNINNQNNGVRVLALSAVGMCCLLDGALAKTHLGIFLIQFSKDDENIKVLTTSLKAMIDLLHCYGLEHFNIPQEVELEQNKQKEARRLYNSEEDIFDSEVASVASGQEGNNIVKFLIRLLDSNNQKFRTIAGEGLAKLLLTQRISSHQILSRLILLLHNPVSEEDGYLTQCLCSFLNYFAAKVPESQTMLEEAFLPTIRTIEEAPDLSPLRDIDSLKVAEMILGLTRSNVPQEQSELRTVHNDLAFQILNEILNEDSMIRLEVLVKALKYLDVQIESEAQVNDLLVAIEKAEEMIENQEKNLLKDLTKFKSGFKIPENPANAVELNKSDEDIFDDE